MWTLLTFLVGCGALSGESPGDGVSPGLYVPEQRDTAALRATSSAAYQACVTDAGCDPGEACTTVPGYASAFCSPACDPQSAPEEQAEDCAVVDGIDAVCMNNGRCARTCGDPDTCPEDLACRDSEVLDARVCAGEERGGSGFYGTCTHPMVEGPDCPANSTCLGGSLLGIDDGICLPHCNTGECPEPPEDLTGLSPLCFDATSYGLDNPVCVLLCQPDIATCPEGQVCNSYGGFGVCAPEGFSI